MSAHEMPQGKHQEPPQGKHPPVADAPAPQRGAQDPPALEDKPKRQLTEEQLRNLARGRKLALEARKAKAIVRHAGKLKEKMAVAEAFNQEVEEAKATIERGRAARAQINAEGSKAAPIPEEDPPPSPPPRGKHPPAADAPAPLWGARPEVRPKDPSPKDRYYLLKLQRLEAEMQEQQARAQYAAAPPRVHAYDVARGALKARADRAVYENVYRDMFGGM
jgi:hypothetical protein